MHRLSISRAWDETRLVLARDGKLIGTVALALFLVPGLILNALVPATPRGSMPTPGPWLIVGAIAFLISLIGQISIIRLAIGPATTVGQAIQHGAKRALPLIGALLIWALPLAVVMSALYARLLADPTHPPPVVALAVMVLGVAGIFLGIRFLLVGAVASAEPTGSLGILKRSWELTQGNWWRLFGFFVTFFIGALVILWASASVLGLIGRVFLGGLEPLSLGWLLVMLVSQALSAMIYTVLFVMQARLYTQHAEGTGSGIPITHA